MVKPWFKQPLSFLDLALACLIICLITWHPFYLHQQINLFELGLYLPGIQAVLDGQIPYKDFFYLRAPLDLYVPALLMKMFGINAAVLCAYFYAGTVITLCVAALIAWEIIPTRLLFYSLIPVLVTRTFPRVVFTYWGGMRYAWGLLAVWCMIRFLKVKHRGWLLASALLTVIAGLTSIEIGVSLAIALSAVLILADRRGMTAYWLIVFAVLLPFNYFFATHGAWGDYMNSQMVVVKEMTKTFPQTEVVPSSVAQVLHALVIPTDKNFRQMTPVYAYIFFIAYLIWRWRKSKIDVMDLAAIALAVYGFMVYVTGFRNLWANVFEMSLQPQKIILFYLLARIIDYSRQRWRQAAGIALALIVISSLVYSIDRANKRFLFFRKDPLKGQSTQALEISRLKGFVVPKQQAEDILQLRSFVDTHVLAGEPMLMYPEMGAMHFILERPWVGKFPTATLAWFSRDWFDQWMKSLGDHPPRYAVRLKQMPDYFDKCHFKVEANRRYFKETMDFIEKHYDKVLETGSYWIMELKSEYQKAGL